VQICAATSKPSPFAATSVALINSKTSIVQATYVPRNGEYIAGYVWAPKVEKLAVLQSKTSYGKMPGELLSWLGGHPIPYESFELVVIDSNAVPLYTRILAKDLLFGQAAVHWK
jgi:hypothetical protein